MRLEIIKQAIVERQNLRIIYHGGSQPGATRIIFPIVIKENRLRAKCFNSNIVKEFIINKIEIDNQDSESKEWSFPFKLGHYSNISEIIEKHGKELESLGWHIRSDTDSISLHRKFKNGCVPPFT